MVDLTIKTRRRTRLSNLSSVEAKLVVDLKIETRRRPKLFNLRSSEEGKLVVDLKDRNIPLGPANERTSERASKRANEQTSEQMSERANKRRRTKLFYLRSSEAVKLVVDRKIDTRRRT